MTQAVRSAKGIHDRVIRSLLAKYKGHELHAEGDVFMIHFDETTDAVAWCLATQQVRLCTHHTEKIGVQQPARL